VRGRRHGGGPPVPGAPAGSGGRHHRRALGQHFLGDPAVAARIVDAVGATAADLVCEIGAGEGVLTGLLAARAGRVVALEVDPRLHARLASRARRWPNVELQLADARTFPYESLAATRPAPDGRVLVAGNLPYSASKPILGRLLEARAGLTAATLMLQREVAERLVAAPGGRAYGLLSVVWQTWADLALLFGVPPGAFRPPPAVESAVIQAAFRASPRVAIADPAAFLRVVVAGFAQRRKTLANALRAGFPRLGAAGIAARLAEAGVDGHRRAETLTLEEFARLARFFAAPEAA
jgi:16S rRNA (adenine1518-N6/adenine1519-N6)-dimethyltransferase